MTMFFLQALEDDETLQELCLSWHLQQKQHTRWMPVELQRHRYGLSLVAIKHIACVCSGMLQCAEAAHAVHARGAATAQVPVTLLGLFHSYSQV
jgi:hypothetical protein